MAFDGGRMTSDAGILLLAGIERRLGIADRLAACMTDPGQDGKFGSTENVASNRVDDILDSDCRAVETPHGNASLSAC